MHQPSLKRRSLCLYDVADRVGSAEVAALLRRYAAELAVEAKARSRARRYRQLARARRHLGLLA